MVQSVERLKRERKLDDAARAAWLYYVAGNTQEEIAAKLHVSRQAAQRLVALAVQEKLVKFRIDHPLDDCIALEERFRHDHGLQFCRVTPSAQATDDPTPGLAIAAAEYLESILSQRAPLILGFATGRTLRATVQEIAPMSKPEHQIVTIVGTMSKDGKASPYDVAMRLADRIGASCYPMPTPVLASSIEEGQLLQTQQSYRTVASLAARARLHMVGIAEIGLQCPLHRDGFMSDAEIQDLVGRGAVGEIAGWPFDAQGRIIECSITERLAGLPLSGYDGVERLCIGGGGSKIAPIEAAIRGRVITGLITDEWTASNLLDRLKAG